MIQSKMKARVKLLERQLLDIRKKLPYNPANSKKDWNLATYDEVSNLISNTKQYDKVAEQIRWRVAEIRELKLRLGKEKAWGFKGSMQDNDWTVAYGPYKTKVELNKSIKKYKKKNRDWLTKKPPKVKIIRGYQFFDKYKNER